MSWVAPEFDRDAVLVDVPGSDYNHDGAINSQDYFDSLAAFFTGC